MKVQNLKTAIFDKAKKEFKLFKPYTWQMDVLHTITNATLTWVMAGNRVGKTYVIGHTIGHIATGIYPTWWIENNYFMFDRPVEIWIATVSMEKIKTVIEPILESSIHESYIIKKRKAGARGTLIELEIKHISGGVSKIIFKSYDQGEEKWQGDNVDVIWLDEQPNIRVLKEAELRITETRAVQKGDRKIIITAYPSILDEVYLKFTENVEISRSITGEEIRTITPINERATHPIKKTAYIRGSWADNPLITEEEKARLRTSFTPEELQAREFGIASIGTGLVYPVLEESFTVNTFPLKYQKKDKENEQLLEPPEHFLLLNGMDTGFIDPTAVLWCAWDVHDDVIYVYKEYYFTHRTVAQNVFFLDQLGANKILTMCDPAGRDTGNGLRIFDQYVAEGMFIRKAKKDKPDATQKVLEALRTGRLKVFDHLTNFHKERRTYSRKEHKIQDGNDHLMNCLEYVIVQDKGYWQRQTPKQDIYYQTAQRKKVMF